MSTHRFALVAACGVPAVAVLERAVLERAVLERAVLERAVLERAVLERDAPPAGVPASDVPDADPDATAGLARVAHDVTSSKTAGAPIAARTRRPPILVDHAGRPMCLSVLTIPDQAADASGSPRS